MHERSPPLHKRFNLFSPRDAPSYPTHTASDQPKATADNPYLVSDRERTTYYRGISSRPPQLLYRSNLLSHPSPTTPLRRGTFTFLPTKTVHGISNTPLAAVWGTVSLRICDLLKDGKINYSIVQAVRFALSYGAGSGVEKKLGPVVVWIAVYPGTTTAENAHDASPGILALLEANGVEGAVVEWYEGAIKML